MTPARKHEVGAARIATAAMAGYVAGLLPSAAIASRLASNDPVDLHSAGSGNPGATNAAAQLGTRWGLFVLALDLAKGAAAAVIGRCVAGDVGAYAAGAGSVAGHVFPASHGFEGGKGVATSAGASLVLFPTYFPVDAGVAALSAARSANADLAIRISCAAWIAASVLWWRRRLPNAWGPPPGPALPAFTIAASSVMLAKLALLQRRARAAAAPSASQAKVAHVCAYT